MYSYQQTPLLRWCASLLLVSALAISLLAIQNTHAFAAACDPAAPLDAAASTAGAPVNCDMSITAAVTSGGLTLANDAAATVSNLGTFALAGADIHPTFTFTSLVKDHRGSTSGWNLEANSAGLTIGGLGAGTNLGLTLTGKDAASACHQSGTTGALCTTASAFAAAAVPLTTTAASFMTAGDGTAVITWGLLQRN